MIIILVNKMDSILNIKGLSIQDKIDLNNGIKFIKVPTEELKTFIQQFLKLARIAQIILLMEVVEIVTVY